MLTSEQRRVLLEAAQLFTGTDRRRAVLNELAGLASAAPAEVREEVNTQRRKPFKAYVSAFSRAKVEESALATATTIKPADGELAVMIDNNIESLGNVATAADEKALTGLAKLLRKVSDTLSQCRTALVTALVTASMQDADAHELQERALEIVGEVLEAREVMAARGCEQAPFGEMFAEFAMMTATTSTKPAEGREQFEKGLAVEDCFRTPDGKYLDTDVQSRWEAMSTNDRSTWTCEQWAKHVGAWENTDGHVCFGSWQALNAMLIQFTRALAIAPTMSETRPDPLPQDRAWTIPKAIMLLATYRHAASANEAKAVMDEFVEFMCAATTMSEASHKAIAELRNIAEAKRFDREYFECDAEFADWAQSRARHTLAEIERIDRKSAGGSDE